MLFLNLILARVTRHHGHKIYSHHHHHISHQLNDEAESSKYLYGKTLQKTIQYSAPGISSDLFLPANQTYIILNSGKVYDEKYYKFITKYSMVQYVLASDVAIQEFEPTINYKAAMIARTLVNSTYVDNAEGPNTFDDKTLIQYSFKKAGYSLTGTVNDWFNKFEEIPLDGDIQYGDIVFFGEKSNLKVAMVIGRESSMGMPVKLSATEPGEKFTENLVGTSILTQEFESVRRIVI